jgi:hypothetical protein
MPSVDDLPLSVDGDEDDAPMSIDRDTREQALGAAMMIYQGDDSVTEEKLMGTAKRIYLWVIGAPAYH